MEKCFYFFFNHLNLPFIVNHSLRLYLSTNLAGISNISSFSRFSNPVISYLLLNFQNIILPPSCFCRNIPNLLYICIYKKKFLRYPGHSIFTISRTMLQSVAPLRPVRTFFPPLYQFYHFSADLSILLLAISSTL